MTKSALKGRADDPRACRGVIRATLFTLPLVVFVSLALVPLSANVDFNSGVSVQRCEAYAAVEPTEYGYQFLEAIAGEAGLSVNDTVATVVGITAGATGLVLSNSTGIVLGASGNNALDNLADAADYPAWDTLDQSQQTAWVSKSNYDAAKFNSLMNAFGLDGARERFYSSGGNFEFTENELDNVKRLGRIGNLWASNIGVGIDQLRSAIFDQQAIESWFPASNAGNDSFDSEGVEDWPSGFPRYVNYQYPTNECCILTQFALWGIYSCSSDVYSVMWVQQSSSNGIGVTRAVVFSTEPFTCQKGSRDKPRKYQSTAISASYQGNTFYYDYYLAYGQSLSGIESDGYTAINYTTESVVSSENTDYMGAILFGSSSSGAPSEVTVPEYPDIIPEDEDVYYPPTGITPDTNWNVYIQIQRPDNEYNPDDKTGTPEWKQETKQNVLPLQNIRFDKLFPFCLMTDVKDLTEKIEDTITPGQQSNYLTIRIPMAYASNGEDVSSEDIELDCTPVRDILVMVRPFNQVLLLFFMVFSLVMFWKSILTGD